jgi:hypothetical protein
MNEYNFRLLDVDLTKGETKTHSIGRETIQRFIGGSGESGPVGPRGPSPISYRSTYRNPGQQLGEAWCCRAESFDRFLGRGQRGRDLGRHAPEGWGGWCPSDGKGKRTCVSMDH